MKYYVAFIVDKFENGVVFDDSINSVKDFTLELADLWANNKIVKDSKKFSYIEFLDANVISESVELLGLPLVELSEIKLRAGIDYMPMRFDWYIYNITFSRKKIKYRSWMSINGVHTEPLSCSLEEPLVITIGIRAYGINDDDLKSIAVLGANEFFRIK